MTGKTIPEVFFEAAEKFSSKTALSYKKEEVYFPITYRDLSKKIKNFCVFLQKNGVKKGDKIAILSENRPEWVIADIAIMLSGAVTVPLHATFSPKAIGAVLGHCKAEILVVSNILLLNKIFLSGNNLSFLKKIIFLDNNLRDFSIGQENIFKGEIIKWDYSLSQRDPGEPDKVVLNENDICSIIYTSGTTGDPKGVELSHKNFLSNAESVLKAVPIKESDVFLSFLPLSHVLERLAGCYCPLISGSCISFAENAKQLPYNLKEVHPTILISVPRIFEKFHDVIWDKINKGPVLKKKIFIWALRQKKGTIKYFLADFLVFKKIREHLGGKLRLTVSGGASLNEKIARFFSKIGVLVLEGYGLTETSPVLAVNRENDFRFGTVGKALENVEIKISTEKEILAKGPNIFKGYYKNTEQTMAVFDKEGWFCTGDLGFKDKDGFLTIIGRKKEIIVTSGGKNIWPEQVENTLNNDKFISQSIIFGSDRKFVSALLVPDWAEVERYLKEKNLSLREHEKMIKDLGIIRIFQERIDQKINPNLCDYERIIKFCLLPSEFSQEKDELTPTLKLRRKIIYQHYQKEIEEIY